MVSATMADFFAGGGGSIPEPTYAGATVRDANGRLWVMTTLHTTASKALAVPVEGRDGKTATPSSDPLRTMTTRNETGILTPFRALTAAGNQSLVTHDEPVTDAEVDNCHFRMLEPHEIAAGMAFPHDYIWKGTKRSRVRMAGNAVTPPAARDLVAAVVDSLETAA